MNTLEDVARLREAQYKVLRDLAIEVVRELIKPYDRITLRDDHLYGDIYVRGEYDDLSKEDHDFTEREALVLFDVFHNAVFEKKDGKLFLNGEPV